MLNWTLGHLLRCKDVTRLVSRAQDGPIPWFARVRLRAHLAACEGCSRFDRQLALLREAAKRYRT